MKKNRLILLMQFLVLLSCSREQKNTTEIEKAYYPSGQLKSLIYHFGVDNTKIINYTEQGGLDYIHNITNNGRDNLVLIFDGKGTLIMIVPYKDDKKNGKSIFFDNEGRISTVKDYVNDNLRE